MIVQHISISLAVTKSVEQTLERDPVERVVLCLMVMMWHWSVNVDWLLGDERWSEQEWL